MSAVAGCIWLDGRPAREEDLLASAAAARHRARASFRFRSANSVAFAYAGDSQDCCQPFHDHASAITLIIDGCIDNLEDVARELDLVNASHPVIVVAAWRRWGVETGARFLGDFLLIIHDERERRVMCIRDPMGQRPLFFAATSGAVVFGSEPRQVLRHPALAAERAINEAMVAEYLTSEPQTIGETLWRRLARLPPAHALEVLEHGGVSVRRYWDFNRRARLDYGNDDEYADHFRDVFTRAVACRLTSTTGVLLSGGIDSSAVAGVAQSLHAAAGKEPLNAFTVMFHRPECDETSYSNAVVRKWGLTSTRLEAQAPDRAEIAADVARSFDWPPYPNGLAANTLRSRAASMGIDRLLTGFGGDDFYTGVEVAPSGFRQWAHLAAGAKGLIRTLRASVGGRSSRQPWIRQEFARRVDLADRLSSSPVVSFPTREQEDMYRIATSLVQVLGDEMEERAASALGLMQRHPFYDRRVAEFGLALPPRQRFDGTHTKAVIRRALADVLPGEVAGRRDKAEFSATYVDALASIDAAAIFSRLRSEEAGWVDGGVIRDMYRRMNQLYSRHDDAYIALVEPLWSVAALELWLAGVGGTAD